MAQEKSKIALVTGASSKNDIGTAICKKLASQGANIFFTYWNAAPEWERELKKEVAEYGVRCEGLNIDLSGPDAAIELMEYVSENLGIPSILVNNAAHSTRDGYQNLTKETLDLHYAVNMRTTFLLCAEFVKRLKKQNFTMGRIINMTSGQELGPMPEELAYAATKGAIVAFTKSLSAEVAPLGISVNAVNPGPTDSTWMTDDIRGHLLPEFPMGRIGVPNDAARIVAFLASEEAQWITGQLINSEGGFQRG